MTATLASVIPAMENMIGNAIKRLLADAGYRGHNAPADNKFRVYMSGKKRRFDASAASQLAFDLGCEPVIGL